MLTTAEPTEKESERKKHVTEAVKAVAQKLGNTPTVCRKYYIHPVVIETYESGKLPAFLAKSEYIERIENERLSDDEKRFIQLLNEPPV